MALSDITAAEVRSAIYEFDELKRDVFLKKYGFGKARGYVLLDDGKPYDSKAIVGAAHGYLPGQSPLSHDQFSGGEASVHRILEGLGFKVVGPTIIGMPLPGDKLTNNEISRAFSVGTMGGMRRSTKNNLLLLISDPFKGLYQDRWEGDILHYTGMGPTGDQWLTYAQNQTLAQSLETGVSVHLVEALSPRSYTYVGEVTLLSPPYQEQQPDEGGNVRNVWMFPLKVKAGGIRPPLSDAQARAIEDSHARVARRLTLDELKKRALSAKPQPGSKAASTTVYLRDAAIAEYVKRLAKGICDLCRMPAPFRNKQREAYLECHHVIWRAHDGEDSISNTVALCPNCHRKMHVLNRGVDRKKLKVRAAERAK